MPVLIDYHVHTDNSMDCKIPMVDMCRQAVASGVAEIAFTDHLNNHFLDIDLGYYDPERYFGDIEWCRSQFPTLKIRAGIEVGEPHRWYRKVQPILERYPYDVVLGSLHWVGRESVFDPRYYRARQPAKAYQAYFRELVTMIEHGGFDVLAHVDLPKRVSYDVYGHFASTEIEDEIRAVWEACIEHNITLEVNTKPFRQAVSQLHPDVDALMWYSEMGGQRLTFGSDAHRTESIVSSFGEARRNAQAAGLHHVCQFDCRRLVNWVEI